MIGYVTVGTNDLPRAAKFYDALAADTGADQTLRDLARIRAAAPARAVDEVGLRRAALVGPQVRHDLDLGVGELERLAQVGELVGRELEAAERADLVADLADVRGQVDARVAAAEPVLHLRTRKLMQHHLHHGELVEVCVQQTGNDHVVK